VSISLNDAANLANNSPKTFLQLIAMDHMAGLAGAMRSRLMAERLAIKAADGTMGEPGSPVDEALKDMNVSVGDTIYMQAPQAQPQAAAETLQQGNHEAQPDSASPPERPAPPADTTNGEAPHRARIWQYLASAVAGAGLVAAGAGIPALMSDRQEAPAAVDTDTDTQYTIGPARITAKDKADE